MLQALSDALLGSNGGHSATPEPLIRKARAKFCESLLLGTGSAVHLPAKGLRVDDTPVGFQDSIGLLAASLNAEGAQDRAEALWKRAKELATSVGEEKAAAIMHVLAALTRPRVSDELSRESARVSAFWLHDPKPTIGAPVTGRRVTEFEDHEQLRSQSVARALFAMPDGLPPSPTAYSGPADRRVPPAATFSCMPARENGSSAVCAHRIGEVVDEFDELYGSTHSSSDCSEWGATTASGSSVSAFGAAVRGLMGFGLLQSPVDAEAGAAEGTELCRPCTQAGDLSAAAHGLGTAEPTSAATAELPYLPTAVDRARPQSISASDEPVQHVAQVDEPVQHVAQVAHAAADVSLGPADPQLVILLRRDAYALFASAALLAMCGSPSSLFAARHALVVGTQASDHVADRPADAGLAFVPLALRSALQAAAQSHAFAAPPTVRAALLRAADVAADSVLPGAAAVATHVCSSAACLRRVDALAAALASRQSPPDMTAAAASASLSVVASALSRQLHVLLRMHCSRMLTALSAVAAACVSTSASTSPSVPRAIPPSPLRLLRALQPWASLLFEIQIALGCHRGVAHDTEASPALDGEAAVMTGASVLGLLADMLPSLLRRLQALQVAEPADAFDTSAHDEEELADCPDHGDARAMNSDVLLCLADPSPPSHLAAVASLVAAALQPYASLAARPLRVLKESLTLADSRAAAPLLALLSPSTSTTGHASVGSAATRGRGSLLHAAYPAAVVACLLLQQQAPASAAALLATSADALSAGGTDGSELPDEVSHPIDVLPWPATDGAYWESAAAARAQCVLQVRHAAEVLIASLARRGIMKPAVLRLLQRPASTRPRGDTYIDAAAAERDLAALLAAASDSSLLRRSCSPEDAATVALLLRWQLPGLLRGIRLAFGTAGLPDYAVVAPQARHDGVATVVEAQSRGIGLDGAAGVRRMSLADEDDNDDTFASGGEDVAAVVLFGGSGAAGGADLGAGTGPGIGAMSARRARLAGTTAAVRAARAEQEAAAAAARAVAEESRRAMREDLLQQAADAAARRAAARAAARAEDVKYAASLADATSPRRADGTLIPTYSHVYAAPGSRADAGAEGGASASPRAADTSAALNTSGASDENAPTLVADDADPAAALVAQARSFLLAMYGRRLQQLTNTGGEEADDVGSVREDRRRRDGISSAGASDAGIGDSDSDGDVNTDVDADPQLLALDALAVIGPSGLALAEETAAALGLAWSKDRLQQPQSQSARSSSGSKDITGSSIEDDAHDAAGASGSSDPADLPPAGRPLTLLASLPTTRDRQQLFRMSTRGQLGDMLVGSLPELALHLPQRFLTHVKVSQPPGGRDRVARALRGSSAQRQQPHPQPDASGPPHNASDSPAASDTAGASAVAAGAASTSPRHETSADRLLRLRAAMGTLAPILPVHMDASTTAEAASAGAAAATASGSPSPAHVRAAGGRGGFEELDEHEDGSFRPHKRALQPPGGRSQLDIFGGSEASPSRTDGDTETTASSGFEDGQPSPRQQSRLDRRPYAMDGSTDADGDAGRRAAVKVSQPPGGGSTDMAHLLGVDPRESSGAAGDSPVSSRRRGLTGRLHPSFESGSEAGTLRPSTVVSQPAGGASSIGESLFPSESVAVDGFGSADSRDGGAVHTQVHVLRPPGGGVSQVMVEAMGGAVAERADHSLVPHDGAASDGAASSVAVTQVLVSQPPGGHSTIGALLHQDYASATSAGGAGAGAASRHRWHGDDETPSDASSVGSSLSVAAAAIRARDGGSAVAALLMGGGGSSESTTYADDGSRADTDSESAATSVRVTQPSGGTATVQLLLGAGQLNEGTRRAAGAQAAEAAIERADRGLGLQSTSNLAFAFGAAADAEMLAAAGIARQSSIVARRLLADAAVEHRLLSATEDSRDGIRDSRDAAGTELAPENAETTDHSFAGSTVITPCALTVPVSRVLQVLYAAPLRCRISLSRTCGASLAVLQGDLFAHYAALRAWMLGGEGRALTAAADAILAACDEGRDSAVTGSHWTMTGAGDAAGAELAAVVDDSAIGAAVSQQKRSSSPPLLASESHASPQVLVQRLNDALDTFRSDVGYAAAWADFRDAVSAAIQAALAADARSGKQGSSSRGHLLALAAGLAHGRKKAVVSVDVKGSGASAGPGASSQPTASASASASAAMEALQELLSAVRSHQRLDATVAHMMRFRYAPAAPAAPAPVQSTRASSAKHAAVPSLLLGRIQPVYDPLQHPLATGHQLHSYAYAGIGSSSPSAVALIITPTCLQRYAHVHALLLRLRVASGALAQLWTALMRAEGQAARTRGGGYSGARGAGASSATAEELAAQELEQRNRRVLALFRHEAALLARHLEEHVARQVHTAAYPALLQRSAEAGGSLEALAAVHDRFTRDLLERCLLPDVNHHADGVGVELEEHARGAGAAAGSLTSRAAGAVLPTAAAGAVLPTAMSPRQRLLQQGKERLEALLDLVLSVCHRGQVFLLKHSHAEDAKDAGAMPADVSSAAGASKPGQFAEALKQLRQGLRILATGVRALAAAGAGAGGGGGVGASSSIGAGVSLTGDGSSHLDELLSVLEVLQPRAVAVPYGRA